MLGKPPKRSHALSISVLASAALALASPAHGADTPVIDIKRASLEELMDLDVYSAARRLEPVGSVPSAIYVLTGEDIRRARVTSIPEALRLVPGVQVARVDANKWAVGIRGFNSRAAQHLLVLVDGRSVYDPLFSGVLWESRDVMLEDVDRIEVIRGPGGTLWGANAVNGVINVITKHARDTQDGLVSAGVGNEEHEFGGARYGWQPASGQYARVYAKAFERGTGFAPTGSAHDRTQMNLAGFRWDWDGGARDKLRISGDVFSADVGNVATTVDAGHRGGNLLARWTRQLSADENWHAQIYYDRIDLDVVGFGEKRDTYDFEFQHSIAPAPRHRVVWGLGYRDTRDAIDSPLVDPKSRADQTASAFVQDTITLTPDKLQLTLGTKFEDNDYSGTEWQPNARLAWTPDTQRTYWLAASRAVRVPSRLEADLVSGSGTRLGDRFQAEYVYAYEAGYRRLVNPNFWYDTAVFYNAYRDLRTTEPPSPPLTGLFENRMKGRTYGFELASRWHATPAWRLDTAYTYLQMDMELDASSADIALPGRIEEQNPHHQVTIRSALDVRRDVEFDATLRFVDKLSALDVPAYTTLDLGLSWFPSRDLEFTLVGQNLLDSHHPEQRIVSPTTGALVGTEVQRGVYTKLTWHF